MSTSTTLETRRLSAPGTKLGAALERIYRAFIASRELRAKQYVGQHLASMSNLRLEAMGFTPAEVSEIRKHKAMPVSFWS